MDSKKRVQEELSELTDKLVNLTKFISTDKYFELGDNQKALLMNQQGAMTNYQGILVKRLAMWE